MYTDLVNEGVVGLPERTGGRYLQSGCIGDIELEAGLRCVDGGCALLQQHT